MIEFDSRLQRHSAGNHVHAQQREELILKLLGDRGFVSFRELDDKLDASPATLRRDLDRLQDRGAVLRVRGGVKSAQDHVTDQRRLHGATFHENIGRNTRAKAAIGRAAAELCRSGESIIIDGGSTTLQMCSHLADLNLQVLSNSLHIVSALLPQPRTRISLPAGTVFRDQDIVLSPFDDDGTAHYHASMMFLGAAAVGRAGLMQSDTLLLQAERRLIERARELVLLVDSSKFAAPAGQVVCSLKEIDIVITDSGILPETRRMLKDANVKLVVVKEKPG